MSVEPGRCPVCRATFRASTSCSRCGADLSALMLLAASAYLQRQLARQALVQGDYAEARARAEQSLRTAPSQAGLALCQFLGMSP